MTDTAIQLPDYMTVISQLTIGNLAAITTGLLTDAADAGLALPRCLSVDTSHELNLQFGEPPEVWDVMAAWADRYGRREDITINLSEGSDGPRVFVEFRFLCRGVNVRLYTNFKANPAT